MAQNRQKFDKPPVIETALSVQFNPLPQYTAAHAGWFWREYLEKLAEPSKTWSQVVEVPKLPDQFERFGAEDVWASPSIKLVQGTASPRTQFIRSDGERMIQIQDSRFILNWRKQSTEYPSYDSLLPEFRTMLHAFESFVLEARIGTLTFNQWEIVYVNQLKKGDMWESARDWSKIFPGLSMPAVGISQVALTRDEIMNADWRFSLTERRGRLYISLRQARIPPSNEEVLHVTFTSRGPVATSQSWEQGLSFGHEALTDTFLAITSPQTQEQWGRKG